MPYHTMYGVYKALDEARARGLRLDDVAPRVPETDRALARWRVAISTRAGASALAAVFDASPLPTGATLFRARSDAATEEGGEGYVEGGWVRAKIFKTRVKGGGEGYVGLDRLGPRSAKCKERPRLAARACAQQQPFTASWRFRVAWPRPQLMAESSSRGGRPDQLQRTRPDAIGPGAAPGAKFAAASCLTLTYFSDGYPYRHLIRFARHSDLRA